MSALGADDCADTSTRTELVAALTTALQRMIAEGDGEGRKSSLRALEELARAASRKASTCQEGDARADREDERGGGATVTRLETARQGPPKGGRPTR
jgi:hypothetical protein